MAIIQFQAVVDQDQVIRPPKGILLPAGPIEVTVRPSPAAPSPVPRPGPGLCKGMITSMAPDFDAPLEDLREYME